jgi:hypothetical protein
MKIMYVIKMTCPLKDGIAPIPFAPTFRDAWSETFEKHSEPHIYSKTPILKNDSINHDSVLLFDSEEELNTWADNCRLTDPQLIADQEMWETAHGITITYEYYSLSPTTGPDPII